MRIFIDSRVGSRDLHRFIPGAELVYLDSGDVVFVGQGENGEEKVIGIERKKIKEFVNTMFTGRFVGFQLPQLMQDCDVVYLVIEGLWKTDKEGALVIRAGRSWQTFKVNKRIFMTRDLWRHINSIQVLCNVHVVVTSSRHQTVQWIRSIAGWWDKDWSSHKSLFQIKRQASVTLRRAGLIRRVASELPGVGWKRSEAVSRHFKTIHQMITASREEWATVEGLGPITVQKIFEAIHLNKT